MTTNALLHLHLLKKELMINFKVRGLEHVRGGAGDGLSIALNGPDQKRVQSNNDFLLSSIQ